MLRIYRHINYFIPVLFVLFILSSCNYVRYISGDKRWLKHDLGLSNTADSLMIPQNKSYKNDKIFARQTGVYYCFKNQDSISTNYISWENGWYTIVFYDINEKQKSYYSYDRKNRLRILVRYSECSNSCTSKIEFNRRGKIIYIQNKGITF